MTPPLEAIKIFLKNPLSSLHKVWPYAKSIARAQLRRAAEVFGSDKYSRPYPNHEKLLKHLPTTGGFFVECGGNDGFGFDPTYYLEKFRGWHGIIIEPIPKAADACRKNRPRSVIIEAALVSSDFTDETITLFDCNFMSVTSETKYDIQEWLQAGEVSQNIVRKEYQVRARTLDSILEEHAPTKIDLLVLDVEGAEESVLRGTTLSKFNPTHILIEIHDKELQVKLEQQFFMQYRLIEHLGQNDFLYKLTTQP